MNDRNRSQDEESKRESGVPGGGKGRKDEVGRSGVYPMSGPHPPGQAEIKEQAAWGQGERGAAGYEDHGRSELTFEGGQVLGGLETSGRAEPRNQMPQMAGDVEIAHDEWIPFLDSFSRQHEDWLATLEIIGPDGKLVEAKERRLKGISLDREGGKDHAYVHLEDSPGEHLTHTVDVPTSVTFRRLPTGEHQALEIAAIDGTTTIIRFRVAARPETLDDRAA